MVLHQIESFGNLTSKKKKTKLNLVLYILKMEPMLRTTLRTLELKENYIIRKTQIKQKQFDVHMLHMNSCSERERERDIYQGKCNTAFDSR